MHAPKRLTRALFDELIPSETSLMIGGFLACGTPETFIDWLVQANRTNLTVIANDTGFPNKGIGRLVARSQIKKAIVSHCGTNPLSGEQFNQGQLELELCPQGTLIERIHSGGAGLGGVLTQVGIGTIVEQQAEKVNLGGSDFLYYPPLRAKVALIKAHQGDEQGNLRYRRTARNFNPIIALAADLVIAEVEEILPIGAIDPDDVMTPGILIDYIYCPQRPDPHEEVEP